MTNEEAKRNLVYAKRWNDRPAMEALDMAIKALEQQPCEDCISREAVLDGIERYIDKAQSNASIDDFISFKELVVNRVKALRGLHQQRDSRQDKSGNRPRAILFYGYRGL